MLHCRVYALTFEFMSRATPVFAASDLPQSLAPLCPIPPAGPLQPHQLTRAPDLKALPESTRKVEPLNDFLGQTRARAAIETALSLPYGGYNVFAAGTS